MREFSCPSCGSPLVADDRFTYVVTCGSCDSTVLADADALEILGKAGALAPPVGVLYLGAAGAFRGRRFRVAGQIRYGYGRGYWDEWLLAFEDGGTGWVSEDEDELSFETLTSDVPPGLDWATAMPGDPVRVDGRDFVLNEKDTATCEGARGMLPFAVLAGEATPYLELTAAADAGPGPGFATVEFGAAGPRLFVGDKVAAADLALDVSREDAGVGPAPVTAALAGDAPRVQLGAAAARNLNCDSCAAPLEIPADAGDTHECEYCGAELDLSLRRPPCPGCEKSLPIRHGDATEAATCPHCGALADVRGETATLVMAAAGKRRPKVPVKVGMSGTLGDKAVTVTGHMRLTERDEWGTYTSHEFALRTPEGATEWLVYEDGDYELRRPLKAPPKVDPRTLEEGDRFGFDGRHWTVTDESRDAREVIDWVEGEFSWVPRVGDAGSYVIAESGDQRLVAEWNGAELEWFRGHVVSPTRVARGLGFRPQSLAPPGPKSAGGRFPRRRQKWVALGLFFGFLFVSAFQSRDARRLVPETQVATAALVPGPVKEREARRRFAVDRLKKAAKAFRKAQLDRIRAAEMPELYRSEVAQMTKLLPTYAAKYQAAAKRGHERAIAEAKDRVDRAIQADLTYREAAAQEWRRLDEEGLLPPDLAGRPAPDLGDLDSVLLTRIGLTRDASRRGPDLTGPLAREAFGPHMAALASAEEKLAASVEPPVSAPGSLPETWPAKTLEFTATGDSPAVLLYLGARDRGLGRDRWLYVQADLTRAGDRERLYRFARRLGRPPQVAISTGQARDSRRERWGAYSGAIPLPGPGEYRLDLRAIGGRRGSRVIDPVPVKTFKVSVWPSPRPGQVAAGFATLFFAWFCLEWAFTFLCAPLCLLGRADFEPDPWPARDPLADAAPDTTGAAATAGTDATPPRRRRFATRALRVLMPLLAATGLAWSALEPALESGEPAPARRDAPGLSEPARRGAAAGAVTLGALGLQAIRATVTKPAPYRYRPPPPPRPTRSYSSSRRSFSGGGFSFGK